MKGKTISTAKIKEFNDCLERLKEAVRLLEMEEVKEDSLEDKLVDATGFDKCIQPLLDIIKEHYLEVFDKGVGDGILLDCMQTLRKAIKEA